MEDVPPDRPRIGALCRRVYEILQARVYGEMPARGFPDIRPAHSSVFRHIAPGGSRVVELAEKAAMTKQSMAYLTESLADAGYVRFEPDPRDGRAKLVKLTDKGRKAFAMLVTLSNAWEETVTARMTAAKVERLRTLLAEVVGV